MKWACVTVSLPAWCLWGGAAVGAQEPSMPPPASPLQQCAALCDPTERLVCYDRLAAQERPLPAPAVPGGSVSPRTEASAASPAGAIPRPAEPAAAAPHPPPPKESFGLYTAEHPVPPPAAKSLTARIIGLGTSPDGRSTVELEGGQLWLLEELDPLLAKGESVTIKRAAFGSFLMLTSKGRTHRVHRLQ